MKKKNISKKYNIITSFYDKDFIKLVEKKKGFGISAPLSFGIPIPVSSYYYEDYKSGKRYSDDGDLFLPKAKQGFFSAKPISHFVDEDMIEKINQNGMTPDIAEEILEIATQKMAK